jgi:hypothetical protein
LRCGIGPADFGRVNAKEAEKSFNVDKDLLAKRLVACNYNKRLK